MLFTNKTFQCINFSITTAAYFSGTVLIWDHFRNRVVVRAREDGKPRRKFGNAWDSVRVSVSCAISALFGLVSSTSVWIRYTSDGRLDLSEPETIFQLASVAVSSISVLFVFSVLPATGEIATLLNILIQVCTTYDKEKEVAHAQARSKRKPGSIILCDVVFAATLASNGAIVLALGLIYLSTCELHFFHVLLPDLTCGFGSNPFVRILLATMQTLIMAHYIGTMNVVLCYVYPAWFFLPTMLKELRTRNGFADLERFLEVYRSLQVLQAMSNASILSSYVIPGHFAVVYSVFVLGFNTIVKQTAPALFIGMCAIFCGVCVLHYIFPLSQLQSFTGHSSALLRHVKATRNLKQDEKLFKAIQPLKTRLGSVGYFDNAMYFFIATVIIQMTINVVLL